MGAGGFEPPKAEPTGLQPVPFGRSGTPPGRGIVAGRAARYLLAEPVRRRLPVPAVARPGDLDDGGAVAAGARAKAEGLAAVRRGRSLRREVPVPPPAHKHRDDRVG